MASDRTTSGHTLEVLDRGVRLITAPMPARASVSVALMFRVGSRYEAPPRAGISHFLEHMVFKGSAKYPTALAVAESIEGVGGVVNAATDKELTMFWAKVARDKLPLAVDVLCDLAQHPALDEGEAEKEREVIVEELRMYLDSPTDHVHSVFEEMLFPDHPLGVDVAGTEASVRATTVADMAGHLREHYRAGGLVVAVGGAVEHDEVTELLAPRLAAWDAGTGPGFVPALPAPPGPRVRLAGKDTEQANIILGARCASYLSPDRFAVDLMNTVLGEGMSSRLFQQVRERLGVCYDVHSWTDKLADTGTAAVYIGTDPGRAVPAVGAVLEEIHRLCVTPVEAGELGRAREFYKGRLLLYLEGTNSLATWLGGQELLTDRIMEVQEVLDAVDAVTAEDVMRVAHETFAAQPLQMAVVGPFESEQPLLDLLQSREAA